MCGIRCVLTAIPHEQCRAESRIKRGEFAFYAGGAVAGCQVAGRDGVVSAGRSAR